ncbi:MAG: hypothetical protein Q9219_002608 [cf. Caloplaca sp. 3 TL-2023]
MPTLSSTSLTITNPLVLYRSLLATKRIDPDPAQHRLALHLQNLYHRLKDYEPAIDYKHRLDQLSDALARPQVGVNDILQDRKRSKHDGRRGIFSSFLEQKDKAEALALTKRLTNHESAVRLQSPQGLLLYGEVGTGKSMLVDLLAFCLPNRKKRRRHFNTFMLETFARLEDIRRVKMAPTAGAEDEHSLLSLARDMISTSPILFLDEFQLPDRAASKLLSNLFTSFFHLGGVLIATSNRMPEELADASGTDFAAHVTSRLGVSPGRWSLLSSSDSKRGKSMSASNGDSTAFLEVLRARCEVWNMEGDHDWRRLEAEGAGSPAVIETDRLSFEVDHALSTSPQEQRTENGTGNGTEKGMEQGTEKDTEQGTVQKHSIRLPRYYFVHPSDPVTPTGEDESSLWDAAVLRAVSTSSFKPSKIAEIPWQAACFRVYGRNLQVPRQASDVSYWTFEELCVTALGPADYITLASNYHTIILTQVPILTMLHKNEARRLITLLDALYEAHCRLLVRGAAGPDDIFFPETQPSSATNGRMNTDGNDSSDGVYPETFSEIYQDQTSPFRANVSSYRPSASPPAYETTPLPSATSRDSPSTRSVLADEDSDFGPTYGASRSSTPRYRGTSDGTPGAGNEIGRQPSPDFACTASFVGEDEKFAYKRARSRLWQMCGARWWGNVRWQPLEKDVRRWENSGTQSGARQSDGSSEIKTEGEEKEELFRHGASPFRTSQDPPPKIPWTHAWGMMKWGKKAGAWGQGPEGLGQRQKCKENNKERNKSI